MYACLCVFALLRKKRNIKKVEEWTKIHCKQRKLIFTKTTFHLHLENFIVCRMERFA
jgi:hypothetical protein